MVLGNALGSSSTLCTLAVNKQQHRKSSRRHRTVYNQPFRLNIKMPPARFCYPHFMFASLETVLLAVWQQVLIDKNKTVDLGDVYPVRQTSKSKLKQIDFHFENRELRGIEQNPNTKSRWAKMAREGKQVMQFLERGKYIAVVVDGKVRLYE